MTEIHMAVLDFWEEDPYNRYPNNFPQIFKKINLSPMKWLSATFYQIKINKFQQLGALSLMLYQRGLGMKKIMDFQFCFALHGYIYGVIL